VTVTDELRDWLALIRAPGIGPATGARLLDFFHSAQAVLAAGPRGWRSAGLDADLHAGLAQPDADLIATDLEWLKGANRHLITILDDAYPPLLREVGGSPLALFCQGDVELLKLPQIAIVGARSATPQGLENARAFAAELTRRGLVVTSGLALGIDGAAHRGALEADGLTIAVCATGLDRVYPASHKKLAHQIAEKGLLISEFPLGTAGRAEHFPRRNRLISGLSLGTLVVEAALESGSLITARLSSEQGREVFAIPGSIHNPMARGCHRLIRQGAKLVETVDDILEEIAPHIVGRKPITRAAVPSDSALHEKIVAVLGDDVTSFDTLLERSGLDLESLNSALLALELSGRVATTPGGGYQKLR
jgi:DNA processing protein